MMDGGTVRNIESISARDFLFRN